MISFRNNCAFWYSLLRSNDFLILFHYKILNLLKKNLNYIRDDKKVRYIRKNLKLVNFECHADSFHITTYYSCLCTMEKVLFMQK